MYSGTQSSCVVAQSASLTWCVAALSCRRIRICDLDITGIEVYVKLKLTCFNFTKRDKLIHL